MKFNKKIICYVSHYLIEHDELFLKSLCESGYETHLIAFTEKKLSESISAISNLNIHYQKIPDIFNSRKYSYPFLIHLLKKIITKVKPDILHSGWIPKDGLMATLSGFHPHLSMPWGSEVMVHPYENILYRIINNFVFTKADHISCDSEHVKGLIVKDYKVSPGKVTVFPWGIDLRIFNNKKHKNLKRSELGWDNNIVLIMTRKFEKFYRIDEFIDVFYECLKSNDNLRLYLLGSGSLEKNIKAKIRNYNISDYVHCPGWVSRQEINNYLNSANIYVSNSYTDGSSVSLLEAIVCGLSPIVTKIKSIEEWVEDDYNGFLVDRENPNQMRDRILYLADSKEKLNRFSKNNKAFAQSKLDWNKNFAKLEHIYNSMTK